MFSNKNFTKMKVLEGTVSWSCPSNIAIVKYWGKRHFQIPCNSSLSFTLSESVTKTKLSWRPKKSETPEIVFEFDGKSEAKFEAKIKKYIFSLYEYLPVLESFDLRIDSTNTFPHSAGIASSASSMGALALCLSSLLYKGINKNIDEEFFRSASELARLGSGSASRSIYPIAALWGQTDENQYSSNQYALPLELADIHEDFQNLQDSILIVSSQEKSVSSRAGHGLMNTHPYAQARYKQAKNNLKQLLNVLKTGDWKEFARISEEEALSLHALMMSSTPSFFLLENNSLEIIKKIKRFQLETNVFLTFTIDAGPNIHLLYPKRFKTQVEVFIKDQLVHLCEGQKIIRDFVGTGPKIL